MAARPSKRAAGWTGQGWRFPEEFSAYVCLGQYLLWYRVRQNGGRRGGGGVGAELRGARGARAGRQTAAFAEPGGLRGGGGWAGQDLHLLGRRP